MDNNQILQLSQKEKSDIIVPTRKGILLYEYQKVGVEYLQKVENVLLADEMGLGKTIQVISFLNTVKYNKILIVCPASLKLNWQSEFKKFSTRAYNYQVLESKTVIESSTNVFIVNYNILDKIEAKISDITFDIIVFDEAHYIKNEKTKRYKSAIKLQSKKKIAVTGTPIINRPMEIYTIIQWLDKSLFQNRHHFGVRYCNGKQVSHYGGAHWDYSGASNLSELQEKLKSSVMIRRLKKDVLSQLPLKTREIIKIAELSKSEKLEHSKLIAELRDLLKNKKKKRTELLEFLRELAVKRHEIALSKIEYAIQHIEDILVKTNKVIVFAHHKDVLNLILKYFQEQNVGVVKIDGSTPSKNRQDIVKEFQENDKIQIFLGSIKATGTGITLTASSTIIFLELDFSPSTMTQAEDRAHRIGQESNVLVQHLVYEGGIDNFLAKMLLKKQEIIKKALDD